MSDWKEFQQMLADNNGNWRELLNERENQEIVFATIYAAKFHHGTAEHNRLMLIAKLTMILQALTVPNPEIVA